MRYLAEYLEPTTGKARLGTGTRLVREYASDRNALRFMHRHLAAGIWPSGQYRVIRWPVDGPEREVGHLYKMA